MRVSRTFDAGGPPGGFGAMPAWPRAAWAALPSGPLVRLLAAIAIGLTLIAPLAVTRIPLLVDYPNHLARMHVLATGAASPALRAMFAIDWAFIPNMAMDVVVPLLVQVMALDVAGRVFIALAILLPPLGVVALHRAWFGTRVWWPWIAALTGVNGFVLFGFLNYVVGVGLALLGAAWHARRGQRAGWGGGVLGGVPGGVLGGALWGTLCLASHIAAFGLLVLLMLSTVAGQLGAGQIRRGALERPLASMVAAAVLPLVLYVTLGPAQTYASGGVLGTAIGQIMRSGLLSDPVARAAWTLAPFAGASPVLGLVTAAVTILPVVWCAARRRLTVAPHLVLAFVALAAAFALLPAQLADNGMVYQRLALPLVLVTIAGVRPRLEGWLAHSLAACCVALIGIRGATLAETWRAQRPLLRDVEQVVAAIPPGARVLAVRDGGDPWHVDPDEAAPRRVLRATIAYQHLPALVTLERDAFWPMVFSTPGKQPVRLRAEYDRQAQSDGYLPLTSQLGPALDIAAPAARCGFDPLRLPCQMWSWPDRYDFVLRLNAKDAASPDPVRLEPVANAGWAALYKVRPAATPAPR